MHKLKEAIREFRQERDWDTFHSPKNLVMALMVESAELAEHFQWLTQEQSLNMTSEKKEAVKKEIADVLIYLINLSDKLDIDPLQAAWDKLQENKNKYPAARVKGKALKYSDYE